MTAIVELGAEMTARGVAVRGQSMRDRVLIAAVGLSALFAHRDALQAMVETWNASPMYSYGFSVPVISAYLLWTQRQRLRAASLRPSLVAGLAMMLAVILLTTLARTGGIQVIDQLAFLASLTACVLLVFGAAHLRIAWAALAYLALMVPLWDGFTEPLHEPFQLRSAIIGTAILQAIGVPAFREGMLISLPNLKIEVARACSGVNYLVAVVALGLPLAYLHLRGVWRRLALLFGALAVAALSNGLRVALIGLLAYLEIGSPLHGPFHVLHGLFVAGIGYVVLFAGLRVLSSSPGGGADTTGAAGEAAALERRGTRGVQPLLAAALIVSFLAVGVDAFVPTPHPIGMAHGFDGFPSRIGGWVAVRDLAAGESAPSSLFGADSELRRRYRNPEGAVVDLYVGYFASQSQGREMVNHRTAVLHNGVGRASIGDSAGRTFDVNASISPRDQRETLFWYDLGAGPEPSAYRIKGWTVWNAMWRGRTNGAVVVLTSTLADGTSAAVREFAPLVVSAVAARLQDPSGPEESR